PNRRRRASKEPAHARPSRPRIDSTSVRPAASEGALRSPVVGFGGTDPALSANVLPAPAGDCPKLAQTSSEARPRDRVATWCAFRTRSVDAVRDVALGSLSNGAGHPSGLFNDELLVEQQNRVASIELEGAARILRLELRPRRRVE